MGDNVIDARILVSKAEFTVRTISVLNVLLDFFIVMKYLNHRRTLLVMRLKIRYLYKWLYYNYYLNI